MWGELITWNFEEQQKCDVGTNDVANTFSNVVMGIYVFSNVVFNNLNVTGFPEA